MSTPGQPSFFDTANPLFAGGPARLDCGTITVPGGAVVHVLTIRTPSTTTSAVLTAEGLRDWARIISDFARSAGGPRLAVPSVTEAITLGKGNGRPS